MMLELKNWTVPGDLDASGYEPPVALLSFNRPDMTREVLDRIRQRRPRRLLLVADGPRPGHPTDAQRCDEVRRLLTGIDWPCEVSANFATANLGCGLRISSGLDWVFETVEEAVVLEDDCVPADQFFDFMAAMLQRYRDDTRIGLIGGTNTMADHDVRSRDSYFFTRYPISWGWATWRRCWRHYDFHLSRWPDAKADLLLGRTFGNPLVIAFWYSIFDRVEQGLIDTWDFQLWFASFANSWLNIMPGANLVSNIGSGPDATHATPAVLDRLPYGELSLPLRHPQFIVRNLIADQVIEKLVTGIDSAAG